ncbi:MAG: homocitrate synthase family protein [Methanoregula sp.]|jgi:methanogen homocitrate synthase|uniref:homocitrate synthase family protein n=1 Tax=Methanoregula sp. TaxID=2052170 RepID=UPI0025D3E779|nr:homocitrate synthase family protein [Methanoregula sp.]MCK9631406.1 homocitrate synthase family protein [Methanoregula sp.]
MNSLNIEICDVTLRDGEQTPGVSFSCREKVEIATMLDEIGIEMIEAGFPAVSENEKHCVKTIANLGLDARISGFCRAKKPDIQTAIDCGVDIVSIFIPTSELHVRLKFKKPRGQVLEDSLEMIDFARDHGMQVRFAAEDASRTDLPFLKEVYQQAAEHGAVLLSYADTVGCLIPSEMSQIMAELVSSVDRPFCAHCHNDMGCAVANTLTAAEAGAFQLHTTVNGIGERAGNASLEELLVALRMKKGIDRYDLSKLTELSHLVEKYSGVPLPRNKPVTGELAFSHESGIHIAAILEDPSTYEFFPPDLVGGERHFILGKHTGKKALEHVVASLGCELSETQICAVLDLVKDHSEHKCNITPEVLRKLIKKVKESPA